MNFFFCIADRAHEGVCLHKKEQAEPDPLASKNVKAHYPRIDIKQKYKRYDRGGNKEQDIKQRRADSAATW